MPTRPAALLALALPLVLAAPAQADFGISTFTAAPTNPAAGAHSDFNIAFDVDGSDDIRNLDLNLPPGLVGNPNATPKCARATFESGTCPANTIVGSTSADVNLGLSITASGDVFNLEPMAGEPARLGLRLDAPANLANPIRLESAVSIRSTSDFGLTSRVRDMPNEALLLFGILPVPITVTHVDLTLKGDLGGGKAFMTNPTSC